MAPDSTFRLRFRCWDSRDGALARLLWGDARVMQHMGGPLDETALATRLERELQNELQLGFQYWPMFDQYSDEFVGCAGLKPRSEAGMLSMGYHLVPAFWGKGLATEAARGVVAHAFGKLAARTLFAGHHPLNEGSKRVLLKLGFRYWRDELYQPTGLMHPGYLLEA